jgi:RNA polymerase sigma-70 factor (ECF subfamily)
MKTAGIFDVKPPVVPAPNPNPLFPATRWTLLQRVREGTPEEARAALDTLCRAYWQPLYCVARQRQMSTHDAQDAVQGFFECLLRRETFEVADPEVGKLRQLLLHTFEKFCRQQWQNATRLKRGGGAVHVELNEFCDIQQAEQRFLKSSAAGTSIEALYNREWAGAVLERSLNALQADYTKRGWQARYDLLIRPLLQEQEDDTSLTELAAQAGMTAGALRVNLHRMRTHYRQKIEHELAVTLDTEDPQLIHAELVELFKAFS